MGVSSPYIKWPNIRKISQAMLFPQVGKNAPKPRERDMEGELCPTHSDGSLLVGAEDKRGALLLVQGVLGVPRGLEETATDLRVQGHVVSQLHCP